MFSLITRRRAIAAGSLLIMGSAAPAVAQSATTAPGQRRERPAPLPDELVREFVGAAHSDLDRVREMLAGEARLANATWDWGGGDFETAIGAAAHMGRPDIASVLLEHKARLDIPAAAMLGKLEVVRAACEAVPGTHLVPGAHGIPLIEHARKGGEPAVKVLEYLESLD